MTVISVALFDVGSQPLSRRGDGPAFEGFKPTDILQQFGNLRRILSGQFSDLYSHGIRLSPSHGSDQTWIDLDLLAWRNAIVQVSQPITVGVFHVFPLARFNSKVISGKVVAKSTNSVVFSSS